MRLDSTRQLDQLRNLLMEKCQIKKRKILPDVRVKRMRITPFVASHHATQSEFQVEYIMVERDEESIQTPAPHQDHDDYDIGLPSPDPPSSPQPGRSEDTTPGELPRDIQHALDLLPTKNDLKPKKKYKKKLPDVAPLPKRRKTVLNNSYAEVDDFIDLPPAPSSFSSKKKQKLEKEDDEYVPPEEKEPQYSKGRRIRAPGKDKKEVKAQKITFFQCQLIRFEEGGDASFKCSKCDAVLQNRWDILRAHVVKEHTDRIVCALCGKHFGRLSNLRSHMDKHKKAGKPSPKTPCDVCGRPCSVPYLKDHMWTHYSEEDKIEALARGEKLPFRKNKNFQCDQCEKGFYSMGTLEAHIKEVHEGIAVTHKRRLCTICGANVRNLVFHMKQIHGEKKFVCVICDKKFVSQHNLKAHQFHKHGTEKPFQCSECGKGFKCPNALKQHHTNIHVNAKVYQCEFCPMKFTQKKVWYERHLVKQHGVEMQQREEVVMEDEQDVKVGEEQLQPVNLCQQNLSNVGVIQMPNPHFFY
ncbi:putative zinc finger protein [Orchesella cincta]|uniref:Putative zinc finger protein n=1 Tax=Orchesella cincta TaxID=48709 RepID=A0A1D2MF90_ORCCI|nr:putative zinc finger protein [Orchesella cincta]